MSQRGHGIEDAITPMPIDNLLYLTSFLIAVAIVYGFRRPILGKFRRFTAENTARRREEMHAVFDKYAHYRQTISFADEQIEAVSKLIASDSRTGTPVERFVFLGVQYPTLAEAEAARHEEVIAKAREFYKDLDKTFLQRRKAADPLRSRPRS
jgi:hypothetical protein